MGFGVTAMLGSWTQERGAELYCLDPSGISYGYWGCAAGKAKSNAKTELEKLKMQELTCADLVKEAAKIIYMVHDEVKDKMFELELSWVGDFTNGVHQKVPTFMKMLKSSPSLPWKRTVILMRICHRHGE